MALRGPDSRRPRGRVRRRRRRPNETLRSKSGLPAGGGSFFEFARQSKDQPNTNFQQTPLKDPGDEQRFSYPTDHPLTPEFEAQMAPPVKEYEGDGESLSVHHPLDQFGTKDDAPDATALALPAAAGGGVRASCPCDRGAPRHGNPDRKEWPGRCSPGRREGANALA